MTFVSSEAERRRQFIASWRERLVLKSEKSAGNTVKLDELDSRHLKGELKEKAAAANAARADSLGDRFRSVPCARLGMRGEGGIS